MGLGAFFIWVMENAQVSYRAIFVCQWFNAGGSRVFFHRLIVRGKKVNSFRIVREVSKRNIPPFAARAVCRRVSREHAFDAERGTARETLGGVARSEWLRVERAKGKGKPLV
jgi:hypothetical protein